MKIIIANILFLKPLKRTVLLVIAALFLLAGCSRGAEATPRPTDTPAPEPFHVTYCDIDTEDICLEGFGLDIEERLLVLFQVINQAYTQIYMLADGPDGEIFFECQQSEQFSENVYCLGDEFPEGDLIKLHIYSNRTKDLLAIGVFNVQFGGLPESDVIFHADGTPTPSATGSPTPSPAPSYPTPSYPNPSYSNPTITP